MLFSQVVRRAPTAIDCGAGKTQYHTAVERPPTKHQVEDETVRELFVDLVVHNDRTLSTVGQSNRFDLVLANRVDSLVETGAPSRVFQQSEERSSSRSLVGRTCPCRRFKLTVAAFHDVQRGNTRSQ